MWNLPLLLGTAPSSSLAETSTFASCPGPRVVLADKRDIRGTTNLGTYSGTYYSDVVVAFEGSPRRHNDATMGSWNLD